MQSSEQLQCELSLLYIKPPFSICFLFTLMDYFGSEEYFETNVCIHDYHALVPVMEQFLNHELDSFYIKLMGKVLSSSVPNALQPQTGLWWDWTRAALEKKAK